MQRLGCRSARVAENSACGLTFPAVRPPERRLRPRLAAPQLDSRASWTKLFFILIVFRHVVVELRSTGQAEACPHRAGLPHSFANLSSWLWCEQKGLKGAGLRPTPQVCRWLLFIVFFRWGLCDYYF